MHEYRGESELEFYKLLDPDEEPMSKWRVSVQYETEIEAEDEGYALIEAEMRFNFGSEARAEEIYTEDEDE